MQRLHELNGREKELLACLASAAQAWAADTGNDARKQAFEAVEQELERVAKERSAVYDALLGAVPALPTADTVVSSSLPPLQYMERVTPGNITTISKYPDFVEEWCDVEARIQAQAVPPGHLPALSASSTPVWSSEKGLASHISETMIGTLNKLLQLTGSPAQWVQSPSRRGHIPIDTNLDNMGARQPQFELILQGQRMGFLYVELPEMFRHMPEASLLYEWGEAQVTGKTGNGVHSITHATNHASTWGCRYGAITTYNMTWLLQFSQRGVYISRPFAWNDTKPSALQALWCLTQQALGSEGRTETWEPLQELPRPTHLLDAGSAGQAGDGSTPAAQSVPGHPTGKETQAGSGTEQAGTWLLQGATEERVAGYGISGWAIAARLWDGREVVVKHSQEEELQQQLMHEAHILETKLRHLMGQEVVELVGHGWAPRGKAYWLATRLVQGDNLRVHLEKHPGDAQVLHAAAAAALRSIHAAGVIHGDVRRENILVQAGGAGSQDPAVVFIDFGMAEDCRDATRHAGEQRVLSELFEQAACD